MSISSEITRINTAVADAYTSCDEKGATMPQVQNVENLAETIDSISTMGSIPWGFFAGNTLVCLDHLSIDGNVATIKGSVSGRTFILEE